MEWLTPGLLNFADKLGALLVLVIIAIAVITDKLIWHKRYEAETKRADRWEKIALDALSGPAQAGVRAAEVAVGVVSHIPDPQGERDRARAEGTTT